MTNKRIPRPGDIVRVVSPYRRHRKPILRVVVEATYTNGIQFAFWDFAWTDVDNCTFVRRATDKEYFRALRKSENTGAS